MKRAVFLALLLLSWPALPLTRAAVARPATAHAATVRSFPSLHAFADTAVRDGKVPSIVIAVGVDEGRTAYISAGHLTTDPNSPRAGSDTLWRIYSMTKPVTAAAAMILVDEGKLRLDQPIGDFIPEFRSSRVLLDPAHSLETRPASRPITVRDLMTHTSGLNYALPGLHGPAVEALAHAGVVPFSLSRAEEDKVRPLRPTTLQEFARRAARAGLVADPGTRFSYSMGLDVLAAVVERASDMPFAIFVQRKLFNPLEMRSTFWQVPRSQAARLATNYGPASFVALFDKKAKAAGNSPWVPIDPGASSVFLDRPSFPYGGAGLITTAHDYDRFLHMLQNDGSLDGIRIMRKAIARLMKSNLLPAGVTMKNFGPVPDNEPTGFGAGGFVTIVAADGFGRRRGTYGWDGAAGSRGWVDSARHVRATMMINVMGATSIAPDFEKAAAADVAAMAK